MGTLYLVATPIGNLEDITARALRVLREVGLIAAEDTRRTRKLLTHFGISAPLCSYFEHNKLARLETILGALAAGDVALVSDAGTPALSDPGYELVRAALAAGHSVTPIPGPSAIVAALVASGLPTDAFTYLGYLPRKVAERRRFLRAVAGEPRTLVLLEAPHRLLASLADVQAELGERPLAVARELTKLHEEIFRGLPAQAIAHFTHSPPRGEITLVVAGAASVERVASSPSADVGRAANSPYEGWDEARLRAAAAELMEAGYSRAAAARQVAARSGRNRREVYRIVTQ